MAQLAQGFDTEKRIAFPSTDGRILELIYDRVTNNIQIKETLDGETESISTNFIELQTMKRFLDLLEMEQLQKADLIAI